MDEQETEKKRSKFDIAIYVLSALLLVALGAAAMYGWRYGNVDTSVAAGNILIEKDGSRLIDMTVDENLNATVYYSYFGRVMTGKLVLAGAETDTILFQLKNLSFTDGTDPTGAVFFIRIPRTGLQGDFSGAWMTYFSYPPDGVNVSEWVLANEDQTATVGWKEKYNAITAQRKYLYDYSSAWTWVKNGTVMVLTSA